MNRVESLLDGSTIAIETGGCAPDAFSLVERKGHLAERLSRVYSQFVV